jgi:enoyl-CoA hydratase
VARLGLIGRHERLSAERARQLGFVSEVVPDVAPAARQLAEKIARNPPEAVRTVKRLLWGALEVSLTEGRQAAAAEASQSPQPVSLPSSQPELLGEP